MMMRRWIALVLAVLMCGAGWVIGEEELESEGTLAAMRCPSGMMSTPYGHPLARVLMQRPSPPRALLNKRDELGLTEEQLTELRRMDVDFSMSQIDRKAELEKGMINVREVLDQETIETGNLRESLQKVSDTVIEMVVAWVDVDQKAEQVLTPQQRATLEAMMQRGPGMRRGMPPGPGEEDDDDDDDDDESEAGLESVID